MSKIAAYGSQRQSLFESSDKASKKTSNAGYELSNPSSYAIFYFLYRQYESVTWKIVCRNRKILCAFIKLPIRRSDRIPCSIMHSTNQGFIEFQSRAIFIFEQSQVGCTRASRDRVVVRFALFAPPRSSEHGSL